MLSPTADCWELVNPWCSLVTLTAHLKQMGQVPQDGEWVGRGYGVGMPRVPGRSTSFALPPSLPSQRPLPSWLRTDTW